MKNTLFVICFLSVLSAPVLAQKTNPTVSEGDWVASILDTMSLERKVAQLIMIDAYSNRDQKYESELLELVHKYQPGGLMFLQGGPVRQARFTNRLQTQVNLPMLIAQDAEWGLAMRLDSVAPLPWPLTVGAVRSDSLAYQMGAEIARQCKRVGVHINFGPVADVNVNPNNPIIGNRSFGESPTNVAAKSVMYAKGMQDQGVLACAKHFPGHGDTDQDSHKTLPTVGHSKTELEQVDLVPFQSLFDADIASVMAAHLNIPALDDSGTPSSLSKKVITDYLRNKMNYDGLVFTDALNMKGVSEKYPTGELEVKALLAGVDVLLMPADVEVVIKAILKAIKSKKFSEAEINVRVERILKAKYYAGISEYAPVSEDNIYAEVNAKSNALLFRKIAEQSITLLLNDSSILPIKKLESIKPAYLALESESHDPFYKQLNRYKEMPKFALRADMTEEEKKLLLNQLAKYDPIIVGVHKSNANPWKSYKVSSESKAFFERVAREHQTVLDIFANPYSLKDFGEALMADALLISYQNSEAHQELSAQIIFGAHPAAGRLPVSPSAAFPLNMGMETSSLDRLQYGVPEEVGMDERQLSRIDYLVQEAIEKGATPGAQVLIAKNGKVVFNKNYGHQTYDRKVVIDESSMYDLASVTKITASVPGIMRVYEEQKLDLDNTLGSYLEESKGTNKEDLTIRRILAHQAQLKSWIPFYKNTLLENGQRKPHWYSEEASEEYPWQVANDLYLRYDYQDSIYEQIYSSELLTKSEYRYSDLGYYLLKKILDQQLNQAIDQWVLDSLFAPLGAETMGYRPLERIKEERIVPSTNDQYFRFQEIKGYVHDPGAAMTNQVNGHAGVFGSANDLAKVMQMYLQKGSYGGQQYFQSQTIEEFTSCQYCEDDNRRGIGFDKPKPDGDGGPTCNCVSLLSFGHTGFTGTLAWADPDEEIVYIFLSNRTFPEEDNRKLIQMDVRTNIQEIIYESLNSYNSKSYVFKN